jgi:hypothetical protein
MQILIKYCIREKNNNNNNNNNQIFYFANQVNIRKIDDTINTYNYILQMYII